MRVILVNKSYNFQNGGNLSIGSKKNSVGYPYSSLTPTSNISLIYFIFAFQWCSYTFTSDLKISSPVPTKKQNSRIAHKQRCTDRVINDFLSRSRHLLVPLLFHEVTSLHPPSFQRNDFSTCIYLYRWL